MVTVSEVMVDSLQEILVQAAEADIEASEAQTFIFKMNNMMLALDARGVTLGYTKVSNLGDTVTIPDGAIEGLVFVMAVKSASGYNAIVPPTLAQNARDGLNTMRLLGQTMPESQYPSTLPIGSGNEDCSGRRTSHYYPDLEAEILSEATGAIGLEVNTNEVADG